MKWFLLIPVLLLAGCASDGSFDAAAFSSATRAVGDTYQTYDRVQHPERYPVGYYP